MASPRPSLPPVGPAKGPLLATLCAQVDLRLCCTLCTQSLNESTYRLRSTEHSCTREILLARTTGASKHKIWRRVGRRPSFPQPARYVVCRYYRPGLGCGRHRNRCTFAHSPEEALVWTFERQHGLPRLWLRAALHGGTQGQPHCPADAIRAEFGGHFQLLCSPCFRGRPPRVYPVGPGGQCPEHRACQALLSHVSAEGCLKQQYVEVRPQPRGGRPPAFCMFVGRGQPCWYGASRCRFAHSGVEMAVWEAERLEGLQRKDLLTPPVPGGDARPPARDQPPAARLYCRACLVTIRSQEAFENHCSSPGHAQMVAFDQAAPWEHRSPPAGQSEFELCPRPDLCEFGDMCTKAHSEQELREWVQRRRAAELRGQAAWQEGLVSYQERLLDEHKRGGQEGLVLAETVEGVTVTCKEPLVHQAKEKTTQHCWTFAIHCKDPLLHVALLKQQPGADFSLVAPRLPPGRLYAQGSRFQVPGCPADFQVEVRVQGASFGSFDQWVTFDFGRRPVLLRKLGLRLGQAPCLRPQGTPAPSHPKQLERWHSGNRDVVPDVEWTAEEAALMAQYQAPALALEFPGSLSLGPISCANYRQRMHQFLYEEEAARQQLVAQLNLQAQVSLQPALTTPALGLQRAPPGALYAEVPLPPAFLLDADQGFLLGREVKSALVAPVPAPDRTVFEVRLEPRASSERALWLLLPARCCEALGLQAGASPVLEVQFQVDPLSFRHWHQAVDALPEACLVVPDLPACVPPHPQPPPATVRGNHKQKLAMSLIAGSHPGGPQPIPPLLIYGPFGTGKTYTLAMASLEVAQQPHARVLICTHTNSAADIYIREYFHGHAGRGHPACTPLRVMYTGRPPRQVDAVTLQYCCLQEGGQAFRAPTRAELERHRLVVTTTTQARELRVPAGFFSHILIDEAAQMLECEALTPLRYAGPGTRLVLAGDHMQVAPRLFGAARAQAAGHTLLGRLFQHYQWETHAMARRGRLIFHENYRCTEAIVAFVSRHFYLARGSPIHACGQVPPHPQLYPLMFCHVAGSPERDLSLTSWVNTAEVLQVAEKVQEAYDTWPPCWGPREPGLICVVSHGAQVTALRQELRRRGLGGVSVGSFEVLPGREFRAVVLSTVHSCSSLSGPLAGSLDFFTDARVLNTVMTRAKSWVVAVGDALALCSFGACSKLWRSFIHECVEHRSVCPPGLSLEQIEQGVAQGRRWPRPDTGQQSPAHRAGQDEAVGTSAAGGTVPDPATGGAPATAHRDAAEEDSATATASAGDAATGQAEAGDEAVAGAVAAMEHEEPEETELDFWAAEGALNADDPILQELLDESRNVAVTVGEDGLLDTVAQPGSPRQAQQYTNLPCTTLRKLLRTDPVLYRRCAFVQETFERATAVPLDTLSPCSIQVRGRLHCGMAFTGDEVLVQLLSEAPGDGDGAGSPRGRVLGVLRRGRRELAFVCRMDTFDPRIMVPLDISVTKIFVAELKDPRCVPIHQIRHGRVQRLGHERLAGEAWRSRLFWVCVVLWRERFYYPLGIVLEVLPEVSTWERGLRVLDLEYGLSEPTPDPAAVSRVLQRQRAALTRDAGRREDCRGLLTFTVDPPGACCLDDALSIRDLGPEYEVAVHITDVATLVPRDGPLDVEARRRGAAFYAPGREPVPMLPASLCRDALSLLPQQDRLAISLFLTIGKDGHQLQGWRLAPSVVSSDHQLTYEDAEQIIRQHPGAGLEMPAHLDSLQACVVGTFHLSRALRRCRLRGDSLYEQLDEDSVLGFRAAHAMVKEYMIQFNSLTAEFLEGSERTRTVTPLRWQLAPSAQQLASLCEKRGGVVPLSLHLSHHLRPHLHGPKPPDTQLYLLAALWRQVRLAADVQDLEQMVDLLATDDMHPSLALAALDLRRALGRSVLGRSSCREPQPAAHYSLQVDRYTWASSPLRRYLDVVLQRQILLVLGLGGTTYTARDIDRLCQDFSRQHARAQSYKRVARGLHLAVQLQAQPCDKLGFVVDVEEGARCFRVLFPANRETLPTPCPVHFSALQLAAHPRRLEGRPGLQLLWRRRVYSVQADRPRVPPPGTLLARHSLPIGLALWRQLLLLLEEQRWPEAASLVREQGAVEPRREELGRLSQSRCGHFVEVALRLGAGDTLQVQLGASLQSGLLAPTPQLWTVAPGLSLCLEHAERPGGCFSGHTPRPAPDRFHDLHEYCRVWEPFCALEAATGAVTENDSVTLQHVAVTWAAGRPPGEQLQGSFCLEPAFLREKCTDINFAFCFLCIRLEGLPVPPGAGPSSLGAHLSIDPDTYTWVAHGLTEGQEEEEEEGRPEAHRQVHFFVHHTAMEKVPEEVLRPGSCFTIEVLPKQLPDLRKEEAVRKLRGASPLVISIALGQPLPAPSRPPHLQHHHRGPPRRLLARPAYDIPRGRHALNPSQNRAIREALQRPFTVIQGPPGTGKTLVALHLTFWFHQCHREQAGNDWAQPGGACVLYCGPSNKSVDVLAGLLLSWQEELRPLRVYSEQAEATEFPVPGVGGWALPRRAPREGRPKPELRSISLHHRIRQPSNPHSPHIRAFDRRVQRGDVFSEFELTSYRRILGRARRFELERHTVVLCTCSCAGSASLKLLDVRQILVDEAGMATEPETLIPLVHFPQAEKVVLLGDHKQLRPVVRNKRLLHLGLERSLFERYSGIALLLDTQYRMHEGICTFPSTEFYEGKLQTWRGLQRPPSVLGHAGRASCPVLFGHMQGHERSLLVSTEDGHENSKANMEEAAEVVRIAKQLTLSGTVEPKDIAILTPYNAQVAEISRGLLREGVTGVTVTSITRSQGSEWRYVLVSAVRTCPRRSTDQRPTKSWLTKFLGFIMDPNQVNVAITRAQEGLCLIGDHLLLRCCPLWRRLLDFCDAQRSLVPAHLVCVRREPH